MSDFVWLPPGKPSGERKESGAQGGASPSNSCCDGAKDQAPRGEAEGASNYQGDFTTATWDGTHEGHQNQRWRNSAPERTGGNAEGWIHGQGDPPGLSSPIHPSIIYPPIHPFTQPFIIHPSISPSIYPSSYVISLGDITVLNAGSSLWWMTVVM